jgi:tRNA-2-methylthio-N6-dimethylallyladenosine synthase
MRRPERRRTIRAKVARLREAVPGIAIRTTALVGFPGETDADFAATLSLVEEVGFDDAFTFRFSPREGTAALRLPDAVPDALAAERLGVLIEAVRRVARARNAALVGTSAEVLVEGEARRGGSLQARTRQHRTVVLEGPASWIGSYRDVRLVGTTGATFSAVPATPLLEVVAP